MPHKHLSMTRIIRWFAGSRCGMSKTIAAGSHEDIDPEACAVHAWRVSRLTRLGLTGPAAEAVADRVDWHEIAELVRRGCPASLAVAIVE
jgi:hypothetical protein